MKLKKLVKKILKEQSDVLHEYSYCQSMPPGYTQSNITNVISLDEAIKDQQRYIKLGYDKIS